MARWYEVVRTMSWRGRAVTAAAVLAAVLVAIVPVALFAGLIMILIGHVVGGLALFGGSVLAAVAAVTIAAKAGVRHLRARLQQAMGSLAPDGSATDAGASDSRAKGPRVVRLSEGEYRIT